MNKSELIAALAQEGCLHKYVAEYVVNDVFEAMTDALVRGEGIELRGFGSFTTKHYKPYVGRNPKTGEKVKIPAKKLPFFKTGKALKERVKDKIGVGS